MSGARQTPWLTTRRMIVLGVLAFVLALVVRLPADWAAWALNRYSHGKLMITRPLGTVWSGSGQLVLSQNNNPILLGPLRWSLPAWKLVTGTVRVKLNIPGNQLAGKVTVDIGWGGDFGIRDVQLLLPADVMAGFYPPAALISPAGMINVESESLSLGPKKIDGSARIRWNNAGSTLSPVQPLGTYQAEITGKEARAEIRLTTVQGALQLAGQGNWQPFGDGRLNFNGTAQPREKQEELETLLKLLGRDLGGGKRLLKLNTVLRIN